MKPIQQKSEGHDRAPEAEERGEAEVLQDLAETKRAQKALAVAEPKYREMFENIQAQLKASEERYRELFENSRDAIYVHDLGGRYISVNRAAELLSGFDRQEILGRHYSNFIAPRNLKNARESFCRKLDAPVETIYEAEVVCKNGHRIPVEISSRMIYHEGHAVGVQGIARDITERKRSQQTLQDYSRRLMEVQEAERQNLSRELHDEIGQALTAIRINLEWIRRSIKTAPEALPRIDESIEAVDDAVRRVRELALQLRPRSGSVDELAPGREIKP